jgi:hypothetical protein
VHKPELSTVSLSCKSSNRVNLCLQGLAGQKELDAFAADSWKMRVFSDHEAHSASAHFDPGFQHHTWPQPLLRLPSTLQPSGIPAGTVESNPQAGLRNCVSFSKQLKQLLPLVVALVNVCFDSLAMILHNLCHLCCKLHTSTAPMMQEFPSAVTWETHVNHFVNVHIVARAPTDTDGAY